MCVSSTVKLSNNLETHNMLLADFIDVFPLDCVSTLSKQNHNEILKHNDDCPLSSTSNGTESSQLQSSNQSIQPPTSCSCLPSISNGNDSNIPINIPINIPVVQASANIKSVTATSNVTSEQPLDLSLHSRSALIPEVDKSTNHVSDTSSSSSLLRIPQPVQTNTKQGFVCLTIMFPHHS